MANDNRNHGSDHNSGHTESRSEEESLKRREYRGPDGEIHHHTHTYMEQHGGDSNRDKGRKDDNNKSNNR